MSPRILLVATLVGLPFFSRAERSIYLNTLDLTYFSSPKRTFANQTPEKKPLQVGSKQILQGIWTHAPSIVRLNLPPDALFFSASVGIQKQAENVGSARFVVKAENNSILFDSGLLKSENAPRDFEIPLTDHKVVFLIVEAGNDGNNGDHAVWCEPRLIVEGTSKILPAFVRNDTLTADLTSLQVPVASPAEGLLLGNGTLGASVWGDARNLRFSLDLAGLWSPAPPLSPPPLIGLNPQSALAALSQPPFGSEKGPRRLPLGRFELKNPYANTYSQLSLNHNNASATANLLGTTQAVTSYVHAQEPVLFITTGTSEFKPLLLPPVLAPLLGLPEPEKGTETLPEGALSWFSLATTPPTFVASLSCLKTEGRPFLHVVSAESAANARETVIARLQKMAAQDVKITFKSHTDWWKKFHEAGPLPLASTKDISRFRLARYLLGASARGPGEPGGWLWTFEESDPARLPAALSTGYPANAPLFAASRLGFAETAESQARWHLAHLGAYRQHAQKNFGTEGIVVPGLLHPDGSPASLSPAALAPGLSAQACWPFLLAAHLDPGSPLARESSLAWLEDSSRALTVLAGGEAAKLPKLNWGATPGLASSADPSWHDSLLLRSAFSGTAELAKLLGQGGSVNLWTDLAGRVALPSSADETAPGIPWTPSSLPPSQLLGHHPLHLAGVPHFTLPGAETTANATASAKLWMACAAARSEPDAALALASSLPLGRNGLPLAATSEPGGPQGLMAQTLELIQNFYLQEDADGTASVYPAVPKSWPTASFRSLPLSNGARISAEWANQTVREISVTSVRDIEVTLFDSFGAKGFRTAHKTYRRATGKIIVTLKAGETAVLKAP